MSNVIVTTDLSFDEVQKTNDLILIKFGADWCNPCQLMKPVLNEISDLYQNKIIVCDVDIESNPELTARYGIRSIPALLLINKAGKILMKQIGAMPKYQLEQKINDSLK